MADTSLEYRVACKRVFGDWTNQLGNCKEDSGGNIDPLKRRRDLMTRLSRIGIKSDLDDLEYIQKKLTEFEHRLDLLEAARNIERSGMKVKEVKRDSQVPDALIVTAKSKKQSRDLKRFIDI